MLHYAIPIRENTLALITHLNNGSHVLVSERPMYFLFGINEDGTTSYDIVTDTDIIVMTTPPNAEVVVKLT